MRGIVGGFLTKSTVATVRSLEGRDEGIVTAPLFL